MSKPKPECSKCGVYAPDILSELFMAKKKPTPKQEEAFGERLARLRKRAGLSQRELGEQIGTSQRMVAYYEGQTEYPPTHLLHAISTTLGVSADELLGLKPEKASPKNRDQRLWRRVQQIEHLPVRERRQLLGVIDAFLERHRLSQLARAS